MIVLFLTRTGIQAYNVSAKHRTKQLISQSALDQTHIFAFIKLLKQKYGKEELRVLLSNNASYVLYPVFQKPLSKPIREHIHDYIQTEIPEKLSDSDWDFKTISENSTSITVLVFAPILSVWHPIFSLIKQAKMNISTVEPEIVSAKRNHDPIVGIALKKDIVGKDENTLSLSLPKLIKHKYRPYLLTAVLIILILLTIMSFLFYSNPF